jgi:hypothetical protein
MIVDAPHPTNGDVMLPDFRTGTEAGHSYGSTVFTGEPIRILLPSGCEDHPDYHHCYAELSTLPHSEFVQRFQTTMLEGVQGNLQAVGVDIQTIQDAELHLWVDPEKKGTQRRSIDASILPVIYEDEALRAAVEKAEMVALAKELVLLKIYGNEALGIERSQELLTYLAGCGEGELPEIALEIMEANPFDPLQDTLRWRMDSSHSLDDSEGPFYEVELNGGEPQGDGIIANGIQVFETEASRIMGQPIEVSPKPNIQMMDVLVDAYRKRSGSDGTPVVGYFAWKQRNSLSPAEAEYTAHAYKELYAGDSVAFDPREIEDIFVREDGMTVVRVRVQREDHQDGEPHFVDVDMVRRLHGEPMENMDLWEDFRAQRPDLYYKFIGKPHAVHNVNGISLRGQMINPLNSWATHKGLAAILSDSRMRAEFGIDELMHRMNFDERLRQALAVDTLQALQRDPDLDMDESLHQAAGRYIPWTRALIREAACPGEYGFNESQIDEIKTHREQYVVKQGSLVGHSGEGVHVGARLQLHELDLDVLKAMDVEKLAYALDFDPDSTASMLETVQGDLELEQLIRKALLNWTTRMRQNDYDGVDESERAAVLDNAWSHLVESTLRQRDAIVMERIPFNIVNAAFVRPKVKSDMGFDDGVVSVDDDDYELTVVESMVDLNPQLVDGHYALMISRVTAASQPKTNITGGYGGLAPVLPRSEAQRLLAAMMVTG